MSRLRNLTLGLFSSLINSDNRKTSFSIVCQAVPAARFKDRLTEVKTLVMRFWSMASPWNATTSMVEAPISRLASSQSANSSCRRSTSGPTTGGQAVPSSISLSNPALMSFTAPRMNSIATAPFSRTAPPPIFSVPLIRLSRKAITIKIISALLKLTFFFGTWEGTRSRNYGFGSPTTLPTMAWRNGDFSDQLGSQIGTDALGRPVFQGEIFDPGTTRTVNGELVRDPLMYQGRLNVIDPARFSPISNNIVPLIPAPQNGNTRNNYFLVGGYGLTARMDQFSVKVDHVFNEKHKASGYFNYGRKPIDIPYEGSFVPRDNPTNRLHVETDQPRIIRFSEDWTLSPTRLNHFGFGFNRMNTGQRCLTVGQGWPEKLGLKGVEPICFPLLTFESANGLNLKTLGDTNVGIPVEGSWIIKDDFTLIHGKHTFQTGFEFRRYFYKDIRLDWNTSGTFNFSILESQAPGFADTGHQFASFLLGAVDTANRNVFAGLPNFVASYPSLYFQDEMKLTPKLTVTTGLRWEIPRPRHEKHNFTSGFDPNEPNPGADGL